MIKKIIDNWDPINLISYCPKDEYDIEVQSIMTTLENSKAIDSKTIYNIFKESFGDAFRSALSECEEIAEQINESRRN